MSIESERSERTTMSDFQMNPSPPALNHSALSTSTLSTPQPILRERAVLPTGTRHATFTLWQRIQIAVLPRIAVLIINSIGRTLRWEREGTEHLEQVYKEGKRAILVCWHCCTFASTYYWKRRGIVVMSSQNFESECLARFSGSLGTGLRAARVHGEGSKLWQKWPGGCATAKTLALRWMARADLATK